MTLNRANKKLSRNLCLLIFLLFAAFSPAQAQVDPKIEWKVLKLQHFDLIYDAKHQDLANLYADRLEDNLSYLGKYFEAIPEKTTVILNDRTDLTNGYATPLPYRTIMLYPVLPGPSETISEYGDWARELSMHEMTHILSFEPRRGVVRGLYYLFGNIITPNMLLPRWWLEGVAVDLETRTSEKGRLRSVLQDASIRAYFLGNAFSDLSLSEINETSIYTWPQGGRPYLFGSLMWSEILSKNGEKTIQDLHWHYGGAFPYLLEGPMEELTGNSYSFHFQTMKSDISRRTADQIKILSQKNFTIGNPLEIKNSEESFFPQISPNGKNMIFLSRNDAGKRSAIILQRPSLDIPFDDTHRLAKVDQKMDEGLLQDSPSPGPGGIHEEDSPPAGAIQRISWFPNSTKFIFDQVQELNHFVESSDLYTFDLRTLKKERLTIGERAREACVSPNSQQVAFVKLDAGRMHLALFNLETKTSQIIYSPALQTRISWPIFLDDQEIIFAERVNGKETLRKYSLADKNISPVLPEFTEAKYPTMTNLGLVFNSAQNGVSNLYLASRDLKTAKAMTHTNTLIAASSYDSAMKEFYAAELGIKGFKIKRFAASQLEKQTGDLPKVEALLKDRYPAIATKVQETDKSKIEDYSVWPYLYPRYWLPTLSFDNNGSILGGSTGSADPLGKHAYQALAAYDSWRKETSAAFAYTNNTTNAIATVTGLDYYTNIVNASTRFRQQQYQARALWQILPISTDLYSGFGWNWTARTFANSRREQNGPSFVLSYSDYVQTGAQISPESGQAIGFQATEFLDNDALENEAFRLYQYSLQKYFSGWIAHHAIMLRLQGQYTDGVVSSPNYAYNLSQASSANIAGGGVISPFYIARGFVNGQFLGKNLNTANLEYRFPIKEIYRGPNNTSPIFFKRVHGGLVVDGANVDGFVYRWDAQRFEAADREKIFWSTGAELKLDITLGYSIPMTLLGGYYVPQRNSYTKDNYSYIGVQL